MGAPDVLQHLHAAGLNLTLLDGKIIVQPRSKLTDDLRQSIKDNRDKLLHALAATRRSGNPLMTAEQADDCHAGAWDDDELSAFTARVLVLQRRGIEAGDADNLAERLTLRDRDGDDRRMCVECSHLGDGGRCLAAAAGRVHGADRRMEPVPTILQRCEAFGLRKGLT
jgi:hypothetical protein